MEILKCKAVSKKGGWVYGYPVKMDDGEILIYPDISIYPESLCYYTTEVDKNGAPLFIGDIVNDCSGGVYVPDTEHPTYNQLQAFPPMKQTGDTTRLGTIIFEDGTIRIEVPELGYAYNLSNGAKLSDCIYVGNTFEYLINH